MKYPLVAVISVLLLLISVPVRAGDPCRDALDDPNLHQNPARAISRLEACLDFSLAGARDRAEARLERGFAYAATGQENKALADYTAVIRLHPDFAPAYSYRGSLLMSRFKLDRAVVDFSRALKLDPTDQGSMWNRSLAYELMGNLKAAIRDAEAYLKMAPHDKMAARRLKKLKSRQ